MAGQGRLCSLVASVCRPAIAEGCVCTQLRAEAALSAACAYVYDVTVGLSGTNHFTGSVWEQGATHLSAYNRNVRMGLPVCGDR